MDINTGTPNKSGVYVCYVKHEYMDTHPDKVLLMWHDGYWSHRGSDQRYRNEIYGWIGPVPAPKVCDLIEAYNQVYAIAIKPDGYHGAFKGGPFQTIQEALEEIGDEGDFIFQLIIDEKPRAVARWSDKKIAWIRRKNKE